MNDKKNILVIIVGKTPQIVTEAFYILGIRKKILISNIFVLTTTEYKEFIEHSTIEKVKEISNKYKIIEPIYDKNHILAAAEEEGYNKNKEGELKFTTTNLILNFISEYTEKDVNIHCVLSGGRKTMSCDGMLAMTLFGREEDKLYHIVANPIYYSEEKYYPENENEDLGLILINKPYIKLRNKLSEILNCKNFKYDDLINSCQKIINDLIDLPTVIINKEKCELIISNKRIKLKPIDISVYLFFAKQRKFISGGKNFSKKNSDRFLKIYSKISKSYGQKLRVFENSIKNNILDFVIIQKSISKIKNEIKHVFDNDPKAEYYIISVEGNYGNKKYGIKLQKNKIKII